MKKDAYIVIFPTNQASIWNLLFERDFTGAFFYELGSFWDGPKEIADSNAVFITAASQAEEAVKAVEAAGGAAARRPTAGATIVTKPLASHCCRVAQKFKLENSFGKQY